MWNRFQLIDRAAGLNFHSLNPHFWLAFNCTKLSFKGEAQLYGDLIFYLFGFSCFAYVELKQIYTFDRVQTGQTGGQPYSDASPYKEILCPVCYLRSWQYRDAWVTRCARSCRGSSTSGRTLDALPVPASSTSRSADGRPQCLKNWRDL